MAGFGKRFTYFFDGEENLLSLPKMNKGAILLSAHIGNWEVAGHFLQRLNTTVHVVMFDGEHQKIKQYIDTVTGARRVNVIVLQDDMSHVYAIAEALQKNEIVCMHADRFVEENKTVSCKFLGADALFPTGPFSLASAFDVPVSFVFAFKESTYHYHFFGSKPLIRAEGEAKPAYRDRLLNAFLVDMEKKITQYPVQWFNYYKFWLNG